MNLQLNRRFRIAVILTSSLLLGAVFAVSGHAAVMIAADVEFDAGFAAGELIAPGTQSGSFLLRQGGVDTTSSYSDSTVTGSNPLSFSSTLAQVGDGVGFDATAASGSPGRFGVGFDALLALANTSLTDTFEVVVKVTYDNLVDADGTDAFSDSELSLADMSSTEIFFTDLISDTFLGDEFNGVLTGTFGEPQHDFGVTTFTFTLAPGASEEVSAFYTLTGESFDGSSFSTADFSTFIEVQSISNLTNPVNPVPEPSSLLIAMGVVGCGVVRRRFRSCV